MGKRGVVPLKNCIVVTRDQTKNASLTKHHWSDYYRKLVMQTTGNKPSLQYFLWEPIDPYLIPQQVSKAQSLWQTRERKQGKSTKQIRILGKRIGSAALYKKTFPKTTIGSAPSAKGSRHLLFPFRGNPERFRSELTTLELSRAWIRSKVTKNI